MSGRYRHGGMGLSQGFIQGFQVMDQYQRGQRQMGLAEQAGQRADERHQWELDERDRLDDQRLVQAMHQGVESGQIDPKIATQFGQRFDVDWSNYVDPEFGSALGVLESTVQGQTSMKSPEFNQAFERVFRTEINKGTGEEYEGADGAHRLEQKRLAGVYPGPDGKTLMVDLEVLDQGPNGPQWRKAPVTKNRSAKDDEVHAIPLEKALDKLKGHQIMYESVQASPELQAVIKQYAARTGATLPKPDTSDAWRKTQELQKLGLDPEAARNHGYGIKPQEGTQYGQPFEHPTLGWVQPGPNGKLTQLTPPKAGNGQYGEPFQHPELGWVQPGPDNKLYQMDKPGAGNKAPADVQTAEWLVAKGIAEDNTAAWNMMSMARSDPSRFVSSYVTQAMKAQEMLMPDEQKSQQQLTDEAMQAYQSIMASARQGRGEEVPTQPAGLEMTGSDVQVLPEDGSAVQQADGSYSGRVNRSAGLNPQPNRGTHEAAPKSVKSEVSRTGNLRPFEPGERVENPDGSHSTERTITVEMDGRFINIPTLWMSEEGPRQLTEAHAVEAAREHTRRTGQQFPSFATLDQAVKVAEGRSAAGGASAPNMDQAAKIKADYKAGKITKEQAIAQLKTMGFE